MTLNIAQVRQAAGTKAPFVNVPVPEWGGDVKLRRLRASQYLDLQTQLKTLRGDDPDKPIEGGEKIEEFYVQLIALCAVDGANKRLFAQAADLEHLRSNPGVLLTLGKAAMEHNGFNTPEAKPGKNSESSSEEGSPSDSA